MRVERWGLGVTEERGKESIIDLIMNGSAFTAQRAARSSDLQGDGWLNAELHFLKV